MSPARISNDDKVELFRHAFLVFGATGPNKIKSQFGRNGTCTEIITKKQFDKIELDKDRYKFEFQFVANVTHPQFNSIMDNFAEIFT